MTAHPSISDDQFIPALHFRAPFGWINDPNGLVFVDGLWHLFYQFHPMSTVWGPMHWGHAVSQDLVRWQNLPIALAPDELGNIFSGSAVVDANNDSGLFDGPSERNLLAFYTSSLPRPDGQPDLQVQSVAYSTDGGVAWKKWEGNPIVGNPELICFRDPKVVWFEPGKHWVMVLTHGQSIGIYRSKNLLQWELSSEFGASHGFHSDLPWECPDLFELKAPGGESRWLLVVGIAEGCPASGSGTQYFVGSFDGSRFVCDDAPDYVRWLDYGRDYYAIQSWFAAPEGRRVAIAWMSNWRYARNTSTRSFRGLMTLPRDLYLGGESSRDWYVGQRFAAELDTALGSCLGELHGGRHDLGLTTFRLRGKTSFRVGDTLGIRLFNEDYDHFRVERNTQGFVVSLKRQVQTADETLEREFPHEYSVSIHSQSPDLELDMVIDNGTVELLIDGGRYSITQLFYPHSAGGQISFEGSALVALSLFGLSSE